MGKIREAAVVKNMRAPLLALGLLVAFAAPGHAADTLVTNSDPGPIRIGRENRQPGLRRRDHPGGDL